MVSIDVELLRKLWKEAEIKRGMNNMSAKWVAENVGGSRTSIAALRNGDVSQANFKTTDAICKALLLPSGSVPFVVFNKNAPEISKPETDDDYHKYVRELYWSQPYLLIQHDKSGKTAAFNRQYKLLHENASQKLIDYAKTNNTETQKFFGLSDPSQFPSWMTTKADMEANCVRYYLYGANTPIDEIAKIPHE